VGDARLEVAERCSVLRRLHGGRRGDLYIAQKGGCSVSPFIASDVQYDGTRGVAVHALDPVIPGVHKINLIEQ
jgi:hypothetical protein